MIDAIDSLSFDEGLMNLCAEYSTANERRDVDLGFNVFALVSEMYQRENLHSDILKTLLDPNGAHGKGAVFLEKFVTFLQHFRPTIAFKDYGNACVERENGRIDILVADYESGHAIIVENKINGAPDQKEQIPRYLRHVESKGLTCDAIVYLRPFGTSKPDTTGWRKNDVRTVSNLLTVVPAYSEYGHSLFAGWLQPCIEALPDADDAKFILKQYALLIKKIGAQNMNKPMMERFYQKMLEADHFQSAISLKSMLDDFPFFRAQHLQDHFQYDLEPYTRCEIYKEYNVYFTGFEVEGAHLDIEMEQATSVFSLWDRNDRAGERGHAEAMLTKMGIRADYSREEGHFRKVFQFPSDETALYEHVRAFKKRLIEVNPQVS